jgi:hypothetical protein
VAKNELEPLSHQFVRERQRGCSVDDVDEIAPHLQQGGANGGLAAGFAAIGERAFRNVQNVDAVVGEQRHGLFQLAVAKERHEGLDGIGWIGGVPVGFDEAGGLVG